MLMICITVISSGRCDFYFSRNRYLPFPLALVVPKYSPLGPVLSKRYECIFSHEYNDSNDLINISSCVYYPLHLLYRIMALTEAGLFEEWLKSSVSNSTTCLNAPKKITVNTNFSPKNIWVTCACNKVYERFSHVHSEIDVRYSVN